MITSIELGDFLSHSETRLEFEDGVTIFVGKNGAGKSSIIDGITFMDYNSAIEQIMGNCWSEKETSFSL